ncbi:MAG: imidazoleglycerol-phosphate dehydratase HisB [Lentisphaeria bacterium]|nr:imidazoleglycerol-phosphate dehydratase HisB [Lentisphaeria bacterium]
MMRKSEVARTTRETDIAIALELDGEGRSSADTGIPFMNHMLELFAKHGFFDLDVRAKGDIEVDYHHTMEDLGLVLGQALAEALGDKAGIRRYGSAILPMDETLVLVALDLSGRPCLVWDVDFPAQMIRDLDVRLFYEFFLALVNKAGMNLHVKKLAGEEVHHVAEAIFKAFAKALDQAVTHDPRVKGVLSTKGSL